MAENTEIESLSQVLARPVIERENDRLTVTAPDGWHTVHTSLESFDVEPRRSRGTSFVHDATSFIDAVTRRRMTDSPDPVIYADAARNRLVAVLNDDDDGTPGWRDYLVELALQPTPEWQLWKGHDGALMGQEAFAEHIENGLGELVAPEPATMLEIAQSFHATSSARFKSGTRLASGVQQFTWEEEQSATAGGAGTIEIPTKLELVLAPFYGSARYEVGAWFRYRITREHFTLGYKLDRPHEVERAAFSDVRAQVTEGLSSCVVIAGACPIPTIADNGRGGVVDA